ncbi:hypothetical protein D3C87_1200380 [compost metagenome]
MRAGLRYHVLRVLVLERNLLHRVVECGLRAVQAECARDVCKALRHRGERRAHVVHHPLHRIREVDRQRVDHREEGVRDHRPRDLQTVGHPLAGLAHDCELLTDHRADGPADDERVEGLEDLLRLADLLTDTIDAVLQVRETLNALAEACRHPQGDERFAQRLHGLDVFQQQDRAIGDRLEGSADGLGRLATVFAVEELTHVNERALECLTEASLGHLGLKVEPCGLEATQFSLQGLDRSRHLTAEFFLDTDRETKDRVLRGQHAVLHHLGHVLHFTAGTNTSHADLTQTLRHDGLGGETGLGDGLQVFEFRFGLLQDLVDLLECARLLIG